MQYKFAEPFADGYCGIDLRLDAIEQLSEADAENYLHLWECGQAEAFHDDQEEAYYDEQNFWHERNGGM